MQDTRRLLIIGLDGATFDLIHPWSQQGKLPHLRALMEAGLQGPLESTFPAVTFPAWSSFMTGKNPGKHGIFDFVRLQPGSYQLEFVGARSRKEPTIWRLLSEHGLRVGIMAVPTTYPPETVNGFMISGFDSPVSTGSDPSFISPGSLFEELREQVGPYRITDFSQFRVGRGWHNKALGHLHETLERKIAMASYLLKKEPWDLFMVLFGESDTVCHHFWAFHDPDSPRHPPEATAELREAILSVYQRLDQAVGELMALCGPKTSVMVVSDHGCGGTGDQVIYLNRWLEAKGFLGFRRGLRCRARGASVLRAAGTKLLPLKLLEQLFRHGTGLANALISGTQLGMIQWDRTRAFSTEMNTLPAIWINLRERQPRGTVSPGREYEQLREELILALSTLRNPKTGQKVVARVHRRENLYQGPCLDQAPDLLLELNLDNGYAYTCLSSGGHSGRRPVQTLPRREWLGAKGGSMNGSHRRWGIFIFSGDGVASGQKIEQLSIMDIAPTILQFFRIPVPDDMDGRVIPQATQAQPGPGVLDADTPVRR